MKLSIVVCTYNRARSLGDTLVSLLGQKTTPGEVEIVFVDNNSSDNTRDVVTEACGRDPRVRYVFEPRQGLPYARNLGIASTTAPLVAFTDDDVVVAPDWVERILHTFSTDTMSAYVGGRVLPRWPAPPPSWLTPEHHWAPLALQDYGDSGLVSDRQSPRCLVAANLVFRRTALEQVGGFDPRFVRIGASSTEDHELQLRLWQAGLQGRYDPGMVVLAEVQPERLTAAYHRRWHSGHGRSAEMMQLFELTGADGALLPAPRSLPTIGGVPRTFIRELARECLNTAWAALRLQASLALRHEMQVRELWSYIRARHLRYRAQRNLGTAQGKPE